MSLPTITIDTAAKTTSVEIVGTAPSRTVNAEERLLGIVSLSPITVIRSGELATDCRVLTRAALAAIGSTPGASLSPEVICRTVYSIQYALADAEEALANA